MLDTEVQNPSGYFQWRPENPFPDVIRNFFSENGFAVLTGYFSLNDVTELRTAAADILSEFSKSNTSNASVFATRDQEKKIDTRYLIESASRIRCFLEEKQESQVTPAVNKIGHALHELDSVFKKYSMTSAAGNLARAVGMNDPRVVQSMYILKNPRIGGEVKPHRDGTYVRPFRLRKEALAGPCLGLWWALEDATKENGCLWAVPGSHRDGIIQEFALNDQKDDVLTEGGPEITYSVDKYRPLPMKSGDLILLHGAVMHMSEENKSEKSRHAYSIHVIDGEISPSCWIQREKDKPFPAL